MNTTVVEWFPSDGSGPITFGAGGDYPLLRFDGSFSTRTSPILRKAAGQIGSTLIDRTASTRTVALQCQVKVASVPSFYDEMATLTEALAGVPGEPNSSVQFGTLRVHRPGQAVVEALAEPVESPQEVARHSHLLSNVDIEWLCPSPLWRETTDQILTLEPAPEDPWVSPWVSPWFSPAAQASGEAINTGHVPVGIKARFFGVQNTVRLVNVTTMEQLQVFGAIGSSDVVEVDTEARTVTVNGVSALDRWDFDGTWWKLRKGTQTIVAEANTADSGARTVVIWRNALAGI